MRGFAARSVVLLRSDGDLPQVKAGTWQGTVTGKAERTMYVVILDQECESELAGTQQLKVVATTGTYAEGRNLRLETKEKAANGTEWLWFHLDDHERTRSTTLTVEYR